MYARRLRPPAYRSSDIELDAFTHLSMVMGIIRIWRRNGARR
jgi:hypothetical protein